VGDDDVDDDYDDDDDDDDDDGDAADDDGDDDDGDDIFLVITPAACIELTYGKWQKCAYLAAYVLWETTRVDTR
jgi:hypothetical protein